VFPELLPELPNPLCRRAGSQARDLPPHFVQRALPQEESRLEATLKNVTPTSMHPSPSFALHQRRVSSRTSPYSFRGLPKGI
jgi:hypothetical protein